MKSAAPITSELRAKFRELFEVDHSSPTGLRWKRPRGPVFVGDVAGSQNPDGYCFVRVFYKLYRTHRIIWALAHDKDPGGYRIDHIDGNPSNNHFSNLRLATASENSQNRPKAPVNSTSGVTGVHLRRDTLKWSAKIILNGKQIYLGCFDRFEEAVAARKAAELKYFGEFAPQKG